MCNSKDSWMGNHERIWKLNRSREAAAKLYPALLLEKDARRNDGRLIISVPSLKAQLGSWLLDQFGNAKKRVISVQPPEARASVSGFVLGGSANSSTEALQRYCCLSVNTGKVRYSGHLKLRWNCIHYKLLRTDFRVSETYHQSTPWKAVAPYQSNLKDLERSTARPFFRVWGVAPLEIQDVSS